MTERAKKLGKYLEEELGWTIYENRHECSKGHINYGGKFCSECGTKLKIIKDTFADDQLEWAIKHILGKKK
jgi:hypothetical protein